MKLLARVLFGAILLPGLAGNAAAQTELRIRGCNWVANALGAPLSEGFRARYSDIELSWDAAEAAAIFSSLFSGAADFGVVSRRMRVDEMELAAGLGLDVRELVVGLDGLAVIVHPTNRVESLSLEQLEALYRGGMASWLGSGGTDVPVLLVSPSEASGILAVFKQLVFEDADATFPADTRYFASTEEILENVAIEPGAIGFVSMSSERPLVRSIPIASEAGRPVQPSPASLSDATYPLRYPVRLYTLGEPEPDGVRRRFLRYLFLHEGAELVADAGFVPIQSFGAAYRSPSPSPRVRVSVIRIGFGFRGSRLDAQARLDLREVASRLTSNIASVWIMGHAEPSEARDDLALARARSIAAYLEEQNVDPFRMRLDSRGISEPISSNDELEGRRENRRAEVWILPH